MDRVKSFVDKNKNDINLTNISNSFQSLKSKISNSFNNYSREQNSSELVSSRSVRSVNSNGSGATNFMKNFGGSFYSNKENVNTNNLYANTTKAFGNLNAKDVSRVSSFAANHPSIAKRGLQAAAYASGDKEMAKKIGQTSNKDIASTASKINKGANFVVENQDKIDEFNNTMDKLNNKGERNYNNSGSSPVNKFVNSSAISNSSSNSGARYNLPKRSSTIAVVPSSGSDSGSPSKISAPPPLPGRINNDVHITRNNSTSSTGSASHSEKIMRSHTVGSSAAATYNSVPSTTKFNKPPPPPVPRHKPDLDKMTEVITSSASNSASRAVNAPPPLPHRPSASKLKKSDSDSRLFNEGNSNDLKGKPITRGNTQPSGSHAPGIKTQSYNNDCANEITKEFNITMPSDNISRYSNVFIQVAENNVVTDSTVKALWMQSGIPKNVLAKIWSFVNRKLDGLLEKSEFIVGMYIIDQYLNGYDIEYFFMDQ